MEGFTEDRLRELADAVTGADMEAVRAAETYVESLAAPPGSLGRLADAAVRLAGITGRVKNRLDRRRIIVMCADNGVVAEGVASTPQIVTLSQAVNMTRGLTGMSAMAGHFGCEVEVVDIGIATPYHEAGSGILQRRIRRGTGNLAQEPAMTRQEAVAAIGVGVERARQAAADGVEVLGVGEMGIGNTTSSAAVLAALTGLPVAEVTGRGAGLTDAAFEKKKRVIERALALHGLDAGCCESGAADRGAADLDEAGLGTLKKVDPIDVLSRVGGLDLAAMCGVFIGAASCRIPVVVDGFISVVAAMCAGRLCRPSGDFMFPSHASEEIGYLCAARELGLEPWLHLSMRLGEGSGCPLAFQILDAACSLMNDMATFEEAQIDDSYLDQLRGSGD